MTKKTILIRFALPALLLIAIIGMATSQLTTDQSAIDSDDNSVTFSKSVEGLGTSIDTPVIELEDGDVYPIEAKPVVHTVNDAQIRMLSYNGSIPGPTIVVDEGDEITLDISNNLDVETTIHPHGINGDSANDGVPEISQEPIAIGGSYQQTIEFPEPGIFWYHPHVREDYTQASGMYANFIVRPKDQSQWPLIDNEEVLQLSDISLDGDALADFNKEQITHTVMGRFGNTQLVNGATDTVIALAQNEVTRLYLTNTSSVRSFKFEIPGVELKLIGGDNGLLERDTLVDSVVVAPSERYIVDVLFTKSGNYEVQNNNSKSTTTIANIVVSENESSTKAASEFNSLQTRSTVTNEIESLLAAAESSGVKKRLATRVDMDPIFMQSMAEEMAQIEAEEAGEEHDGIEWEDEMVDANPRSNKDNTKWSLVDLDKPREKSIDWSFDQGDAVTITIENSDETMHPMQHPIHIHGQKFIVKSINGEPTNNRVFKDVVQIPVGDTYELVMEMENKGTWLIHCHISEHMESGMVGQFTVN